MTKCSPFRYFKTSPEVIRLAVMLYVRFPLSLRNVEDLLHERGIEISHETVRFWWNRFGPLFAAEIRRKRVQQLRAHSNWQWHLDEVFVKINGETHYLWRAVDHEGEVLESYVTKRRDRKAALKFLRKTMKRFGPPHVIVTDLLRSYGAAMKVIGNADKQETGRWLNNRAENSHPLPGSGLLPNHEYPYWSSPCFSPFPTVTQQSICHDHELAHDRCDSQFLTFSVGNQLMIFCFHIRIESRGDHRW
jgi:putative transposase